MKSEEIGLILNIILFLIETGVQIWSYFEIKDRMLKLYTQHSNIIAMLSAFLYVLFYLIKGPADMPAFMTALRFMSTSMLMITFIIVAAVMAPLDSKKWGVKESYRRHMFDRRMPILHFVCPAISFVSYIWFESYEYTALWFILLPGAVTIIYEVVMALLNVLGKIDGPYTFLKVKQQPVHMSVIFAFAIPAAAIIISYLVYLLKLSVTCAP